MQTKKYLVTNNSEGSICVTGRTRIDIPGMCKDLPLSLPENTARQTISRLKQRYPLLKIREVQENLAGNNSKADPDSGSADATGNKSNDKNSSEPDKSQNPINAGTTPDKGQEPSGSASTASATADDKNGSQDASSQNQAATQKPDNKKGK